MVSPMPVRRAVLALAMSFLVAASLAGTASAAQPGTAPYFQIKNDLVHCGTYDVTVVQTVSGDITFFVDNQGELVRMTGHATIEGTATSTTGTVLDLRGHVVEVIDFVRGTNSFNGQVIMANRQGLGVVVQDTGKYIESLDFDPIFVAGPHGLLGNFDAVFCNALR